MTDPPKASRCPICGRPSDRAVRPFCGRRCAQVDLGRWLAEGYRVPAPDSLEDEAGPQHPSDV